MNTNQKFRKTQKIAISTIQRALERQARADKLDRFCALRRLARQARLI